MLTNEPITVSDQVEYYKDEGLKSKFDEFEIEINYI